MKRRIIAYMAMSLDGYIAREDGDTNWLAAVNNLHEDYDYEAFFKGIDTVLMGRKTYEKILSLGIEFPHKEKKCYVFSSTAKESDAYVEYYSQDPETLIKELKKQESEKHIMIDGGAELIYKLSQKKLVDELIISIAPIILGSGIKLFKDGSPEQRLELISSKQFSTGVVQLRYQAFN